MPSHLPSNQSVGEAGEDNMPISHHIQHSQVAHRINYNPYLLKVSQIDE